MRTVLKNSQDRNPLNMQKPSPKLNQNLVFSYSVKRDAGSVILSQLETGFVLSMKVETLEDILRVTTFELASNIQLAYLSPDLSDAALLEIAMQALLILYACADCYKVEEIFFILSHEDAGHLTVFEGFFDKVKPLGIGEGTKASFTLYNTQENRNHLKERSENIKNQLKQGLWQMQKGNNYIKNFLQNHPRGMLLPGIILQDETTTDSMGTVIPFPKSNRK